MIKIFDKNMKEIKYDISNYQLQVFPLDNFSAYGLLMDNEYFSTSEQAFQYLKFINTNRTIAEQIKKSYSPNEAREIGQKNKKYKPDNWMNMKYDLMEKVLRLKVEQNPTVMKSLLNTKDNIIAECCIDEDTDWGIDNNNNGNNNLGKIWMKIREEYKR